MIQTSNFIGYFEFSTDFNSIFEEDKALKYERYNLQGKEIILIDNFINQAEICFLLNQRNENKSIPVGIDGIAKNYQEGEKVHSLRSTIYNEELALLLYNRLKKVVKNEERNIYNNNEILKHYNINPAFRYIHYPSSGHLIPHYDFPFKKKDNDLSLLSVVIYLTSNDDGGLTQFIKEHRENNVTDWNRMAEEKEVLLSFAPKAGSALIFPHQMLHQSLKSMQEKTIIRTDIMYKESI